METAGRQPGGPPEGGPEGAGRTVADGVSDLIDRHSAAQQQGGMLSAQGGLPSGEAQPVSCRKARVIVRSLTPSRSAHSVSVR